MWEIDGGPRRVYFRLGRQGAECLVVEKGGEEVVLELNAGKPDQAWRRQVHDQLGGILDASPGADADDPGWEGPGM